MGSKLEMGGHDGRNGERAGAGGPGKRTQMRMQGVQKQIEDVANVETKGGGRDPNMQTTTSHPADIRFADTQG